MIHDWPKPQSICDIQVFLKFANFYGQFIKGFSKLAALLNSMLKIALTLKVSSRDKNLDQNNKKIEVENSDEKKQHKKVVKATK